jgi:hypothetical protein
MHEYIFKIVNVIQTPPPFLLLYLLRVQTLCRVISGVEIFILLHIQLLDFNKE